MKARNRKVIQFWRGWAGVYYPDQQPPAHVKLAVSTPAPEEYRGKVLSDERAKQVVDTYRATGSLEAAKRAGRCGTGLAKRALAAAGVELVVWRRKRDQALDAKILEAYRKIGTVWATAKSLGMGPSRVYLVLRDNGIAPPRPGRPKGRGKA
jgi:hypothetical protein